MERDCDLCKEQGKTTPAIYDAKMQEGPWAYMCEAHYKRHGFPKVPSYRSVLAELPRV
jgi:hypothetical protein